MSSLIRPVAVFGVITLAIGFTAATAFLASARDSPPSRPDICTTTDSGVSDEAPFLAENESAMNKMMSDMAVKPTGDVDVDFVAMMVPHHQGAVDMAIAVLRYGRNLQIRRLAQEIIVTQGDRRHAAGGRPAAATSCARTGPGAARGADRFENQLSHRPDEGAVT
jgi:hypothetical protein